MSILRAKPSLRDSKNYLASFGANTPHQQKPPAEERRGPSFDPWNTIDPRTAPLGKLQPEAAATELAASTASPVLSSILDPIIRRTALVKMQGPFTDRQLGSVAQGMVYLEKLGLVSVIVVEDDHWQESTPSEQRVHAIEATMTIAAALEKQGARARPILHPVVRLGPLPGEETLDNVLEAHTNPLELTPIRAALRAGEIPVIPPFALDSSFRSIRIDSNHVIAALARGMTAVGRKAIQDPSDAPSRTRSGDHTSASTSTHASRPLQAKYDDVDLTPLRLMIINREGWYSLIRPRRSSPSAHKPRLRIRLYPRNLQT